MAAAKELIRDLLSGDSRKHPIPSMDGPLSPNNRLETLQHLDADLDAPCDLCPGDGGSLLVAQDRRIERISPDGSEQPAVIARFEARVSALTRLQDGTLVVAVNGAGMKHIDTDGRVIAEIEAANGAALRSVTAIAEDPKRGGVYFTVGSVHHDAEDWIWDLMECNRAGLLGYWSLEAHSADILATGLAFPSGLVVEDNGSSLLMTESWTHSIARYHLTGGSRPAARDVVVDNMPGYPGHLARAADGGYWLAVFAPRTHLVELILREKAFKREMMRALEPELWIRPALSSTGSHLEPLQMGAMKKLGIRKPWAPPRSYGLVMRLDGNAEVVDSLHSRVDGHNHGITAAREIGDTLYVVSKGNHRILVQSLGRGE